MTLRPCLDCGEPCDGPRCTEHTVAPSKASRHARGYDNAWSRLSKRARRLQPFCSDCGAVADLTVDHSPQAWERQQAGMEVRLEDVEVVCRSCNGRRGQARPSSTTRAGRPPSKGQGPTGKDLEDRYLIEPDVHVAGQYRLFGVPVLVTNRIPDDAKVPETPTGRAALVDFSQIVVARDVAPSVKVLDQTFGDYDQQAIRVVYRLDAAPVNPVAVIVLTGLTI